MSTNTVVSVNGNTLVINDGKKDSTYSVPSNATVTLNGGPAKLADLEAGDTVKLDGQPITSVSATR